MVSTILRVIQFTFASLFFRKKGFSLTKLIDLTCEVKEYSTILQYQITENTKRLTYKQHKYGIH